MRELQNKLSVMEKSVDCKACSSHFFFFFNEVFFPRKYKLGIDCRERNCPSVAWVSIFHHEGVLSTSEQTCPKVKASALS